MPERKANPPPEVTAMRIRWNRVLAGLCLVSLTIFALTNWPQIVECLERLKLTLTNSAHVWRTHR
jgi:hypothetical protein